MICEPLAPSENYYLGGVMPKKTKSVLMNGIKNAEQGNRLYCVCGYKVQFQKAADAPVWILLKCWVEFKNRDN